MSKTGSLEAISKISNRLDLEESCIYVAAGFFPKEDIRKIEYYIITSSIIRTDES